MSISADAGTPRRVLLATDLTPAAERAEARALALAAQWDAELYVIAVDEHGQGRDDASTDPAFDPAEIADDLRTAHHSTVPMRVIAPKGDAAKLIVDHARNIDASIIVAGAGGPRTMAEQLLGSTAEKIIHAAPMPVLLVRRRATEPYGEVAAATDFSDGSAHAVEAAARLFPEARLTLLHAYRVPFEGFLSRSDNQQQFEDHAKVKREDFLRGIDLPAPTRESLRTEIVYGSPEASLHDYVVDNDVEFVTVGTHGEGGAFHLMLGGVAERLLKSLPCDVLVVRRPGRG